MKKWRQLPLGEILSLEYGKALPARERDRNGTFPVAGSNGPDGSHSKPFAQGPGIVVGRKGSAGKVTWYEDDYWPIDTTYYVVPRMPVEMRWLYYALGSLQLEDLATTTGVPGLNRNDAYRLEVPLPPRAERRRIVKLLDHAGRLRDLRAKANAQADPILSALVVRSLGSPANWQTDSRCEPLGELATPVSGATPSKRVESFWEGRVPWVSPKDMKAEFLSDSLDHVSEAAIQETKLNFVERGSALVVVRGMILARSVPLAINLTPVTINQDLKALIPRTEEVTGTYLWAALTVAKPHLKSLVRSAGHGTRKIDTPDLMELRIPRPNRDQIRQVSSVVETHRQLVERRRESELSLNRLFTLLLSKGLDGSLTAAWREAHAAALLEDSHDRHLPDPMEGVA